MSRSPRKAKTWTTHDMLFCLCGWEEDIFLHDSPTAQQAIRQHRKSCGKAITREQARVYKYPAL